MQSYVVKNLDNEISEIKEMIGVQNVDIVVMHYYGNETKEFYRAYANFKDSTSFVESGETSFEALEKLQQTIKMNLTRI